jgi:RNA ligase (TIGR02306 family)
MRKLASIQKILEIKEHTNADALEIVKVLGWQCVSKKGEFKAGDLCVYFEIDSKIPMKHEWARFLQNKDKPSSPARLKTIKLRGEQSQGLCMPLSIIQQTLDDGDHSELAEANRDIPYEVGDDVTELLEIKKYEPVIPACLGGEVIGARPSYTIKTDEDRVQAFPKIIEEFQGRMVYITQKIDGSSGTFSYLDGDYQVSGRNWSYSEDTKNTFWKLSDKYQIKSKLEYVHSRSGNSYGIQGEAAGPKIQDNLLGLTDHELFVFNVMNLQSHRFLGFYEFREFCERLELQTVPILYIGIFKWKTLEELLELADSFNYPNGHINEGIVIRPVEEFRSEVLCGRASFKVISNKFLIKTGK